MSLQYHREPQGEPSLRRITAAVACSVVVAACAPPSTSEVAVREGWSRFGGENDPTTLAAAAAKVAPKETDRVLVEGTVREVCQTRGCWMSLREESGAELLVRFRDYAYFVPRNATGRHALLYGAGTKQTLSVATLRQLATDAGRSAAEIARITAPKDSIIFVADSVWIQGPGLADPYRPVGAESLPTLLEPTT